MGEALQSCGTDKGHGWEDPKGALWGSYGAQPHLGAAFTQHTAGGGTAAGHGPWAVMGLFWAALGWLWGCYEMGQLWDTATAQWG